MRKGWSWGVPVLVAAAAIGCADSDSDSSSAPGSNDAIESADSTDANDPEGATDTDDPADIVESKDTLDSPDSAADAADSAAPDDTVVPDGPDVSLPEDLEIASVDIEWTLQSTAGESGVLTRGTLVTEDGDLVVGASFRGTVDIGGTTLTADEEIYKHHLFVRVSPEGELRFATHPCDYCAGVLAETPDGGLVSAAIIDHSVTLTRLAANGTFESSVDLELPWSLVTAMYPRPEGGWWLAGVEIIEEVFWPGHARVAALSAEGEVEWLEKIGGTGASSISMIRPRPGGGFVTVGDFGGYPLGVTAEFGPEPLALEALSSDDDPAMDVFVVGWSGPEAPLFARRIQHYKNAPREPTFLQVKEEGVRFRLDSAGELAEEDGEFGAGYGESGVALFVDIDWEGEVTQSTRVPLGATPWPGQDAYFGLETMWAGGTAKLAGGDGPSFTTPEPGQDTTSQAVIFSHINDEGGVARAGQLLLGFAKGGFGVSLHAAAVQPDGTALMYWNGSSTIELPVGAEPLENEGYERMIFARARFGDPVR